MAQTLLSSSSMDISRISPSASIFGPTFKFVQIQHTHFRSLTSFKNLKLYMITDSYATFKIERKSSRNSSVLRLRASREPVGMTQVLTIDQQKSVEGTQNGAAFFDDIKHRFLRFKRHQCLENLENYQSLSEGQAPKFLVIACADSRVCPSTILGFQPGEAFIVRNVANLVPPLENGPTETNAALEFAVNSLEVENILVIGHTCCGGIRALMSMQDEADSSFIRNWVVVGKNARLSTKAAASNLSFDQQCRHCEKESINRSLLNLLSYPWIEERVTKGTLSIHGGYYNFIDCTFEKWTLDYNGSSLAGSGKYSFRDREFWC